MRHRLKHFSLDYWLNDPQFNRACAGAQRAVIWAASLVVPASYREDWRSEWLAELWHVRELCVSRDESVWESHRQVVHFCVGAIPDALCVRECTAKTGAPNAPVHSSAAQCLLLLATLAAACLLIAELLPGIQAERDAERSQIRPGALLLFDRSAFGPEIPYVVYRKWKQSHQRYFDDLAFYHVEREFSPEVHARWKVAHASPNFFSLLGVRIAGESFFPGNSDTATLVLSHNTWLRQFGGDPEIAGTIVHLGTRSIRIAGVAPAGAWRMPGDPDVWALEPEHLSATVPASHTLGYPFGRLSDSSLMNSLSGIVEVQALDLDGNDLNLAGVSLALPVEGRLSIFSFSALLALLALPAIISVSLVDDGVRSHRPSVKQRTYRQLFLLGKFVLVAMIGYYASLDFAYSITSTYSPSAECLQLFACFAICLGGLRWAVADQRQRCPVCLRRVTHPAHVGLASRTFLGWNGTEMMCMAGHTLLHVPALPTSWFSGPRWLYLDSSWDFLFSDSVAP